MRTDDVTLGNLESKAKHFCCPFGLISHAGHWSLDNKPNMLPCRRDNIFQRYCFHTIFTPFHTFAGTRRPTSDRESYMIGHSHSQDFHTLFTLCVSFGLPVTCPRLPDACDAVSVRLWLQDSLFQRCVVTWVSNNLQFACRHAFLDAATSQEPDLLHMFLLGASRRCQRLDWKGDTDFFSGCPACGVQVVRSLIHLQTSIHLKPSFSTAVGKVICEVPCNLRCHGWTVSAQQMWVTTQ